MALQEKLGNHQSQYDLSCRNREQLYLISRQSNRYLDIPVKAKNVFQAVALEKRSGDQLSQLDSSSGNQEHLYKNIRRNYYYFFI